MTQTIRLQGVGEVPAVEAAEIKVGDVLMWNSGSKSLVINVTAKTPKTLQIISFCTRTNAYYVRDIRTTKPVAICGRNQDISAHQPKEAFKVGCNKGMMDVSECFLTPAIEEVEAVQEANEEDKNNEVITNLNNQTVVRGLTAEEYTVIKAAAKAEIPFPVLIRTHKQKYAAGSIDIRPKANNWTEGEFKVILAFITKHGLLYGTQFINKVEGNTYRDQFEMQFLLWKGGFTYLRFVEGGQAVEPAKEEQHTVEASDSVESQQTETIAVQSIAFGSSEAGDVIAHKTVSSFAEAADLVNAVASDMYYNNQHGYRKTDFMITWADGHKHEGRIDISSSDSSKSNPIGEHVRYFYEGLAGLRKPYGWNEERYKAHLKAIYKIDEEGMKEIRQILEIYLLVDEKKVEQPEPVNQSAEEATSRYRDLFNLPSFTVSNELQTRLNSATHFPFDHQADCIKTFETLRDGAINLLEAAEDPTLVSQIVHYTESYMVEYYALYMRILNHKASNPSWAITGRGGMDIRRYSKRLNQYEKLIQQHNDMTDRHERQIRAFKRLINKNKQAEERAALENVSEVPAFKTEQRLIKMGNMSERVRAYVYGPYMIAKTWGMFRVFKDGKEVKTSLNTSSKLEEAKRYVGYLEKKECTH